MLEPNRRLETAVLVLCCAWILFARFHTYYEPLERDLTTYAVIGHELLEGRELYSDLWDIKPPAIYTSYAAAEAVFGRSELSIYALGVLCALLTLFGIHRAVFLFGRIGRIWAMLAWAWICSDIDLQANQPNTEVFINTCVVMAFALFFPTLRDELGRGRAIAIGLLFAIATLFKPVAILIAAALGVCHLIVERKRRAWVEVGSMALAGGAVWLLVYGYFFVTQRADDFTNVLFVYGSYYASLAHGGIIENLVQGLQPSALWPSPLYVGIPLALVALIGLVHGLYQGPRAIWAYYFAWVVGTWAAVALPGHALPHYYQLWLPVLVVGCGWTLGTWAKSAKPAHGIAANVVGIIIVSHLVGVAIPAFSKDAEEWSRVKYGELFIDTRNYAYELEQILEPGETLYQWGMETGFYHYRKQAPPTGLLWYDPALSGPLAEELSLRIIQDLEAKQPELLVMPYYAFPGEDGNWNQPVLQYLINHYRETALAPKRKPFLTFGRIGSRLAEN